MRAWPSGNNTVPFEVLIADVRKAVLHGYKLTRKKNGQDIPWDGMAQGKSSAHISLSPEEQLTAQSLEHHEENGRELLDVLIGIAIQLGVEQGCRIERARMQENFDLAQGNIQLALNLLNPTKS